MIVVHRVVYRRIELKEAIVIVLEDVSLAVGTRAKAKFPAAGSCRGRVTCG